MAGSTMFTSSRELPKPCAPKVLVAPNVDCLTWNSEQLAFFCSSKLQHLIFGRFGTYLDFWTNFQEEVAKRERSLVQALRKVDNNVCQVRLQHLTRRVPDIELPHDRSSWALVTVPRGRLQLNADRRRITEETFMGGRLPYVHLPDFDFPLDKDPTGATYTLRLHQTFLGERVHQDVRWTSELFALHIKLQDHRPERERFRVFVLCNLHLKPPLPAWLVRKVAGFLFIVLQDMSSSPGTTMGDVSRASGIAIDRMSRPRGSNQIRVQE